MREMFKKLFGQIWPDATETVPKGQRSGGALNSGALSVTCAPQKKKPSGSLGGRAAKPNSDSPRTADKIMKMFEHLQDRMRSSGPVEVLEEQHRRSMAASVPRPKQRTDTTAQPIPVISSLGRKTASPQTASSTSSPPLADRPNLPKPIASSPPANSASSHQPTTQSSTALSPGRIGGVDAIVPANNRSVHDPRVAVQLSKKPTTWAPIKSNQERITTTDHVSIDEHLQQLQQAHSKLTEDYGEFVLRRRRPETEAEYRKVAQRAISRDDPPKLARYPRRARSKVRAAVVFVAIEKIRESLETCLEGHDAITPAARAAALTEGHRWVSRIRALEEPIGQDDESGNKMSRRPARRKLRALPDGWELRLFDAARTYPNWFNGVCVSLASGVRPVELERGVRVRRKGVNIEILVQTAKSSEEHEGIGERSLVLAPEQPWVQALADQLGGRTEMVVTWPSAKKSFDAITAIGRSALPDAKVTVSGYVLRHRFASILKKAKWPPVKIAQALGHSSTKQLSTYGIWNGAARSGGLPLQVRSEREPRIVDKPRDFISRRPNRPKTQVAG